MTSISKMPTPGLPSLLFGISLIVIILPVLWAFYNSYIHPLKKFPGPKLAACTNLYYIYLTFSGKLHYKLKELHDQYGDVVRLGPNSLVYRSPDAWNDIYGHRKKGAGSFVKDPEFYVESPNGHSILTANDADHSRERRLLSHAFSEKALREQESLVQHYVDLLVDKLRGEFVASRDMVDMEKWFNYATFDIIGDLAFGEPFDCLKDSSYHPWVKMVFQAVKASTFMRLLLIYPQLASLIKPIIPKQLTQIRQEHWRMSKEKVDRRLQLQTTRPDFISFILRGNDEKGMTPKEIAASVGFLILAGSETTATVLSGSTFYLLTHPATYNMLVNEIRGAFAKREDITFLSVVKLPYLHAVLEESMRLYPAVPAITPRRVPKGGSFIDGQYVPEGISVSMAYFSSFRAKSNFVDPDAFIPERWLEVRDARFEMDKREALMPFSTGPRNCLGKNLAYAEMRLILAKLLWNFDLSLHEDCHDWDDQTSYTIWQKKPLMVKLTPVQH